MAILQLDPRPPEPVAGVSWRRFAFQASLWALVGALYFGSPFLLVVIGWFQEPFSELGGAERVSHRVHEVLFGVIFAQAMIGAASQLRRPERWRAGMLQTLVTIACFGGVLAAAGRIEPLGIGFLLLALVAAVLHPSGVALWWGAWRPQPLLLVLAVAAIPPWVSVAIENMVKAQNQAADHVTHWGGVAAFALIQLILGLLAALRPSGWRLVSGSVGFAGLIYFAASMRFSFDASAKPQFFAFWLLISALVWLAVTWLSDDRLPSVLPLFGALMAAAVLAGIGAFIGVAAGIAFAAYSVVKTLRGNWPRWARRVLMAAGFLAIVGTGLAASGSSDAPNIPHGLEVAFEEVDRVTCLECHATGRQGATIIPHEPGRFCDPDWDHCWDGRNDCMACHRLDPSLREATVGLPAGSRSAFVSGGDRLHSVQLKTLDGYDH